MDSERNGIRRWIVDEAARWWRDATLEARYVLLQRVLDGAPEITEEELKLAIVAAEIDTGEIERTH